MPVVWIGARCIHKWFFVLNDAIPSGEMLFCGEGWCHNPRSVFERYHSLSFRHLWWLWASHPHSHCSVIRRYQRISVQGTDRNCVWLLSDCQSGWHQAGIIFLRSRRGWGGRGRRWWSNMEYRKWKKLIAAWPSTRLLTLKFEKFKVPKRWWSISSSPLLKHACNKEPSFYSIF